MAFKLAEIFTELTIRDAKFKKSLTGVNAKLKNLEGKFGRVSKAARRMLFVGGAAAVGFIKLQADQEHAEKMLDSALTSSGQSAEIYGDRLRKLASEMQKLTVFGDEFILQQMAAGINLGITGDKIGDVTKMAIGLSKVLRMDLSSSMRYTVLAMQGEFTMLNRYLPALRATESATEKLAIIQKAANAGWQQAQDETKTFTGRLKQLKNELGDTGELIGQALMPMARELLKWVQENSKAATKWIKNNQELIGTIVKWGAALLILTAILPKLLMALRLVIATVIFMASTFGMAAIPIAAFVAALVIVTAASIKAKRAMREMNEETARFNATMKAIRGAKDLGSVQTAIKKTREQIKQAADDVKEWAEKRTVFGGIDVSDALMARQARRRELALSKTLGNLLQKEKEFLDKKEALEKGTGAAKGPIAAAKRIQDFLRKQRETDTQREIREVREKYKKFLEIAKKAGEQEGTLSARLAKQQAEDISQIRSKAELKEVEKKIAAEKAAKSKREGQAADVVKPALVGLEDMWRRLSTTGKENKSEARLADIAKSNKKLTDLTARANEILERIASGATAGTAGMVGA